MGAFSEPRNSNRQYPLCTLYWQSQSFIDSHQNWVVWHLTLKDRKVTVSASLPWTKHSIRYIICIITLQITEVLIGHYKLPTTEHYFKGSGRLQSPTLPTLLYPAQPNLRYKTKKMWKHSKLTHISAQVLQR